ncbi:MAG: CocE/NonD family hydrolase [bacterium]
MALKEPVYDNMIQERDVMVKMRDGVHLAVDVYRPKAAGKYPVLYACAVHNKDLQRPEVAEALPPQPAYASLWYGVIEGGDTKRLIANGYVHVIAEPRGVGKSEGDYGDEEWDHYDMIEWIAAQPWCDGKVGMIGISAYGGEQFRAAAQQPPALKAIFPYDSMGCYSGMWSMREFHPGGVFHMMPYLLGMFSCVHEGCGRPGPLPPELEEKWEWAMNNPDYMMYAHLWNILTQKGQRSGMTFWTLIDPYDYTELLEESEKKFEKIKIPYVCGSFAGAYTYKMHWQGAQHWFMNAKGVPKRRLVLNPPAHLERPFHSMHDEIIRWYDYWLKGIETGVMDDPPVKTWIMGENKWRTFSDWPVPETQWTKFYLDSWERLTTEESLPHEQTQSYNPDPDVFTQMPLKKTMKVERLRYMTEPLPDDLLIVGPCSLTIHAALDQDDTNWIVALSDVGPDVSVRTQREGERFVPDDLPERELTRGWLKASHRALDPQRTEPWAPFHKLTREAQQPVVPGEINEYQIELLSTANMFLRGHRICVDIMSLDVPTGTAGLSNIEYIGNHVCSSKTVTHGVYHNAEYPSHLLLPVIPLT